MKNISINHTMTNTIDLNDYNDKGELLTAHKRFFMGLVDEIRDIIVFDEFCDKSTENEQNFFMIKMLEPLDWMLTGMRLGLAFVHSDNDIDFILNTCSWNKGTYFNLKKMGVEKSFIIDSLIKICNDPIKMLSKEKISK